MPTPLARPVGMDADQHHAEDRAKSGDRRQEADVEHSRLWKPVLNEPGQIIPEPADAHGDGAVEYDQMPDPGGRQGLAEAQAMPLLPDVFLGADLRGEPRPFLRS